MSQIPSIFSAISGDIYHDLSNHSFTTEEKSYIGKIMQDKLVKIKQLAETYNIPVSTLYSWKKTFDNDFQLLIQGQQQFLDDKSNHVVVSTVKTAILAKTPLSPVLFDALLSLEREKTVQRRKRKLNEEQETEPLRTVEELQRFVSTQSVAKVPLRTKRRIVKSLNIAQVQSDSMTAARFAACADPRSSYTWLAVNIALCGHLKGSYKWNMDPTTVQVGDQGLLSIVSKGEENLHSHNLNQSGDLCIFIKWLHLCSAGGQMSTLYYVWQSRA